MKQYRIAILGVVAGLMLGTGCGKKDETPSVESIIADTNLVAEAPAAPEVPTEDTNVVINLAEIEAENKAKVDQAVASAKTFIEEEKLAQAARALQEAAQLRMTPEQQTQIQALQDEIQKAMMAKVMNSAPMTEEMSNILQRATRGEQ